MYMIRKLTFQLGLSLLVITAASSQQRDFIDTNLPVVLEWVTANSDLRFNYEYDLLESETFSGDIDLSNLDGSIAQLFYATPFDYEYKAGQILVLPPALRTYDFQCEVLTSDGISLMGAHVIRETDKTGVITDIDGRLDWTITCYKNEKLIIKYLGYEDQNYLAHELEQLTEVRLYPENYDLGHLIIEDYLLKGISDDHDYVSTKVDYETLVESEKIQSVDALNTVQLLPGISSPDESTSNIYIRGARPDQNLIIWENATLYDPGHLYGMVSSINPFVIDQIQIYKSCYHPAYENRLGGVVDISLPDQIEDFSAGVGTTMTEGHAFIKNNLFSGKLNFVASTRKDISGLYNSPTLDNYLKKVFQKQGPKFLMDEQLIPRKSRYSDLNAKLYYELNNKLSAKVAYLNSSNSYRIDHFLSRSDDEDVLEINSTQRNSSAASAEIIYRRSPHFLTKAHYNHSEYNNESFLDLRGQKRNVLIRRAELSNDIIDTKMGIAQEYKKGALFSWGYTYETKVAAFEREDRSDLEVEDDDDKEDRGDFHNLYFNINTGNEFLAWDLGARATYYLQEDRWRYTPRTSLKYQINNQLGISGSAGLFHQYISQLANFGLSELNVNNQMWILNYGLTGEIQRSRKLALGINYHKTDFMIDMALYNHYSDGISILNARQFLQESQRITIGTSRVRGLDLLVNKKIGAYDIAVNYTLSKSEYQFDRISTDPFPSNADQRHDLSIVHSLTAGHWNFNLTMNYSSGLPYSMPSDVERIGTATDPRFKLVYEEINAERLPYYLRWDVSASYSHSFMEGKMRGDFSFFLLNLLDRTNFQNRDFFLSDSTGDRQQVFAYRVNRFMISRTPQLLIRFYFN